MNLVGFLSACGGKPSSKPSEWIFDCWLCLGKEKLYFNTHKLIGFCQKCQKPISLNALATELGGISVKDIQKFVEESIITDKMSMGFKESVLESLLSESTTSAEHPREIALPPTFRTLEDGKTSVIGRKAIAYMEHRGFNLQTLVRLGFGYCSGGYYENRIIVPFWEHGKLVYWQARDFSQKVPLSQKILNPPSSAVSIGKSSVLFNLDEAREHRTVVICESWGSSLATGAAATGLNGKNMSNVQLDKLLHTPAEKFMVLLDHGAEDAAWKTAERLSAHRETFLAFLPYGDPNEVARPVLIQAINNAVPYSKLAHVKYLAENL